MDEDMKASIFIPRKINARRFITALFIIVKST